MKIKVALGLLLYYTASGFCGPLGTIVEVKNTDKKQLLHTCDSNTQKREVWVHYLKEVDNPPCEIIEVKSYRGRKAEKKILFRAEWDGSFCKRQAEKYSKRLSSFGIPCESVEEESQTLQVSASEQASQSCKSAAATFIEDLNKVRSDKALSSNKLKEMIVDIGRKYMDKQSLEKMNDQAIQLMLAHHPQDAVVEKEVPKNSHTYVQVMGKNSVKKVKGVQQPETASYWWQCVVRADGWSFRPVGDKLK